MIYSEEMEIMIDMLKENMSVSKLSIAWECDLETLESRRKYYITPTLPTKPDVVTLITFHEKHLNVGLVRPVLKCHRQCNITLKLEESLVLSIKHT